MREKQNEIQNKFIKAYLEGDRQTCFDISVRVGKTRVGCKIAKELNAKNVLILYPFDTIKKAWEDEWVKIGWKPENITYSTYLSIKKVINKYDIIFADEIQKASDAKLEILNELLDINDNFLGLSGTYSSQTVEDLKNCGLTISQTYTTEQAIIDGIVSDYEVIIKTYKLDDKKQIQKKGKNGDYYTTEAKHLKTLSNRIINASGSSIKFARLNRMRFINNNESLKKVCLKLIKQLENKRFLLYGADTSFIDDLEIPTFHNKNIKKNHLELFLNQEIKHLGLCQLANQGVTFEKLDTIIVTNINSNSENLFQKLARSLLLEEGKKSKIYIIVSEEAFQMKWLNQALENVPNNKIKYEI